MPIGPSHGSRGGFSGGSRSSGGHSSGSRSGGSFLGSVVGGMIGGMLTAGARRRVRNQYEGNGPVDEPATPSRRRPTGFLVLAIIMAFITFFTVSIRNGFAHSSETHNDYVQTMKADYNEYKDIITKAQAQEAAIEAETNSAEKQALIDAQTHFIVKARVGNHSFSSYSSNPTMSGIYKDFNLNGVEYYFIVYEYYEKNGESTDFSKKHTATTYSQFSPSQAQSYKGNSTLEIAYTIQDGQFVSINTNYNLEDCAEYKYELALVESNKQLASRVIIFIVVEVLLIALFVFIFIKKLKKYKLLVKQDEEAYSQKQQAEVDEAIAKAESAQKEADKKNRVCAFCGSTVPDDAISCPSCGSKTFE